MDERNFELYLQITINLVSFIGVVLSLVIAWKESKRLKYIETITNQTINNMLFLRKNSASFSVLIKPEVIMAYKNSGEEYTIPLMEAAVNIESIMKYSLDVEREIMNVVRKTANQCLCYHKAPTQTLEQEIRDLGKQFYNLMTVYDYADWQYIKSQVSSRPYKGASQYLAIYNKVKSEFDVSDQPSDW